MHLIFLHGVPGVGKRTIARELARELGFPFLDFQNLTHLIGPIFGYSAPVYGRLRNDTYKRILDEALGLPEDGLIASFTFDEHIDLDHYAGFINSAKQSGGIGLFLGLTCDDDELKDRVDDPGRQPAPVNNLELIEDSFASQQLETPNLPGPSIVINTTGESPEHTVYNILAALPDDMKGNISF